MNMPNAALQHPSSEPFPGAIIVFTIIEYWWIFLPLAILAYIYRPKK